MEGERRLVVLILADGKSPLEEWLHGFRDKPTRLKILRQIDKLRRDLGLQKSLKDIAELKIDLGPGYRVYYALLDPKTLVVLIGGGDKSTQGKDIAAALRAWNEAQPLTDKTAPGGDDPEAGTGETT